MSLAILCGEKAIHYSGDSFMKCTYGVICLFALLMTSGASAQEGQFNDVLLDHMTGRWLLEGTIAGQNTTHDVAIDWVLGHQYVQIREVSRERDSLGRPAYEATVFIGWDQPSSRYACLWLDNTGGGGLKGEAIAYATKSGDQLPFLFHSPDNSVFHTTFVFDKATDTWRWVMDGEEGGKVSPFARVTLKRK
jgi:hypothetical protein